MSGQDSPSGLDRAAARWRDLAVRRHGYYLDLLRSGRWRHYFTEEDFAARLREVIAVTSAFAGYAAVAGSVDQSGRRSAA
jgi:hypothetical protein